MNGKEKKEVKKLVIEVVLSVVGKLVIWFVVIIFLVWSFDASMFMFNVIARMFVVSASVNNLLILFFFMMFIKVCVMFL